MRENVMVNSRPTLRRVINRSFGDQFRIFMVDHVTQGFKDVTGWVGNQTSLQCAMMYDNRCLSHSVCMHYVHFCLAIHIIHTYLNNYGLPVVRLPSARLPGLLASIFFTQYHSFLR